MAKVSFLPFALNVMLNLFFVRVFHTNYVKNDKESEQFEGKKEITIIFGMFQYQFKGKRNYSNCLNVPFLFAWGKDAI